MDKEKLMKMIEMMKGFCADEEGMAHCCSMIKKMMCHGKGEETKKKKKEAGETG